MKQYSPMLCQKTKPFSDQKFAFEPKLDGVRCLAYLDKGVCTLKSRSGNDLTEQFPEIAYNFYPGGVFDGEIVVLDELGVPRFNHIQHRLGRTNKFQIRQGQRIYPAVYYVFDILYDDQLGDLTDRPLSERRRILDSGAIADLSGTSGTSIKRVPYIIGDGESLFTSLAERGWEGVVGKPLSAPYVGGNRALWKKAKATQEGEFVICGLTKGEGNRDGAVGALVLGEIVDNSLMYVGEAGSGLTFDDVRSLPQLLTKKSEKDEDCPFSPVPKLDDLWYWVSPRTLVEVEYLERSPNGRLRFPAVKRIKVRGRLK